MNCSICKQATQHCKSAAQTTQDKMFHSKGHIQEKPDIFSITSIEKKVSLKIQT